MKMVAKKVWVSLSVVAFAIAVAFPAQALIINADIATNAGISYGKLKLKGKIDSDDIKNHTIKGKDIKKGTISGDKIEDDAIGSEHIDDGSITADDMAAGTLTATVLADGAVTSAKILDGTIVSADLAANAVADTNVVDALTITGGAINNTPIGATTTSSGLFTTLGAAGTLTATGNVNLGDGDDDVAIDSTDWFIEADGDAYFPQVLVTGDSVGDQYDTFTMIGANGAGDPTNLYELYLYTVDPTQDNAITFPNVSGTVITTGDTNTITDAMVSDTLTASNLVGSGSLTNAVDLATAEVSGVLANANVADDITASNYLPLAGGTMSGAIAMGAQDITGAGAITGTALYASSGQFDTSAAAVLHIGEGFATTVTITPTTTITGDLVVNGGDILATPKTGVEGNLVEGTIYYDADDDNLYVRTTAGWDDLTSGATASVTLDDAYNASLGASTILVDNGDLTFRSDAAASDVVVNLNSTGDFILQNNGTDVVTFDDSGNVTMASGTLALNGDTVTSDGTLAITGGTGLTNTATAGDASLIASAASVVIRGVEGASDTIFLDANNDAAGGIDIDAGTGGIALDTTGVLSLDSLLASNFTVTGAADLTLSSTLGSMVISGGEAAADAINIDASDAAGGIDIDAGTGTIDILQTGTIAGNGIIVATTDAGISLSAVGAANGDMTLTAGDAYVATVTGIWDNNITGAATIDAAGVSIDGTAASNFTVTGAAVDLLLSSVLGSVNIAASEATADAITINASAGGVDVTAATNDVDIVASTLDTNITGQVNVDLVATTQDITTNSADDTVLTVGDAYVATVTGIWDNNITGAATIDAAGVSIDGTAASNFTVTGAADLTLNSVGGSVIVSATENAADAIKLESTAGGVDILASGAAAGEDIDITATGSSVNISSTESATDAIVLNASAGGINISATAGGDTEDLTITTAGTGGDIIMTTVDDFSIVSAAGAVIDIADDAVAKTIDIGGVTASGTDAINIATEGTAADVIAIGNNNAATTLALTGGTAWSVTTAGLITTAGDLVVNGDDIDADGTLDVTGGTGLNLNTTAGDIVLDPAGNNVNPGSDSTDSLGEDATRWATIFADTLNYSAAITDDNSANTTVTIGDSNALDTLTVTANTTITDAQWSVTDAGVATFTSVDGPVGSVTPAAGTFTTLIGDTVQTDTTLTFVTSGESIVNSANTFTFTRNDSGTVTIAAADNVGTADLLIDTAGAGAITIGTADVTALTVTTDGSGTAEVVLPAGSIDSTEILDSTVASADIAANTIVADDIATSAVTTDEILDATIAGGDLAANIVITTSGTLTSTGTVDFSGATLEAPNGTALPGTCSVGMIFHDTDSNDCINTAAGDGALCICKSTDTWALVSNF